MSSSPQKENGYTAIANEIMEALARYRLPGEQVQCLLFILRKTYGYHKKTDEISITQFEKATGLARKSVTRAIAGLCDKRLIIKTTPKKSRVKNAPTPTSRYMFNKHYGGWEHRGKKAPHRGKIETCIGAKKRNTKDTLTKDSDILSYITPDICDCCQKFIQLIKDTKGNRAPTGEDLFKNSADTLDKLIRIDGFDLAYIKQVLWFAHNDTFWSDNVSSLASLRRKTEGLTKFQKIASAFEKSTKKKVSGTGRSEQNAKACHDFAYGGDDE
jgi:phage replication O-like protein O